MGCAARTSRCPASLGLFRLAPRRTEPPTPAPHHPVRCSGSRGSGRVWLRPGAAVPGASCGLRSSPAGAPGAHPARCPNPPERVSPALSPYRGPPCPHAAGPAQDLPERADERQAGTRTDTRTHPRQVRQRQKETRVQRETRRQRVGKGGLGQDAGQVQRPPGPEQRTGWGRGEAAQQGRAWRGPGRERTRDLRAPPPSPQHPRRHAGARRQ